VGGFAVSMVTPRAPGDDRLGERNCPQRWVQGDLIDHHLVGELACDIARSIVNAARDLDFLVLR